MARNILLKGLAVAAGAGLLIGLNSGAATSAKRRGKESHPGESALDENPPETVPALDPLMERLDRIESRIRAVEARPLAADGAGDNFVSVLDLRIQRQAEEIERLRTDVSGHREKIAAEIGAIDKRFADLAKGIPAVLESIIVPRVDDLRVHLRSETQQSVNGALTKFERAIDDKVSDRIDTLEKSLLDQSTAVTALSQRAVESDMNVQRLISAVERLCDRNPVFRPAGTKESSFLELPFSTQLNEAIKRKSEEPAPPFESAFRPRIVKEEDETRRHRIPMTQL